MIEKRSSVIQEVMEANATEAVFGQRIDAMATDVFDGSREEQHIFMETLKAMSAHSGDNCSVTSDIMNFHKDHNILLNSLASSSCESSVLASNSFINNSCTISSRPACNSAEVSRSKGFVNNFSSGFFSDLYDAHVKAMKSSFEQQNFMGVALLQGSSLSVSCDDLCDELVDLNQSRNSSSMLVHHIQQPPCVIVESCNRGILSSYYHSRTKKEIDDGNDAVAVGSECIRQEVRDDSIANEAKFVTSPVSQESFAPDLLGIHVNATSAETSELPTSMKYVAEELSIMNSGSINIVSKKALIKELPERLCSHANCLLTDAGWKIEPRVRSDRSKLASYYIAPQGKRVITSLSQAWKACGRSLYSCAMNSEKETNGKEWTNIDRFWSDLTNTLSYIEVNIQNNGISISHLKRWQLLDPFIAVVCINRKISVLREGKSLKAVNSTTIILSEEGDNVLADESTERVCQLEKLNASPERSLNQNPFPPAIHIDYVSITNVPGKQQTWQNCRGVQTSNRYKQQMQKPSNCAVTERKSLRCQAVCKGSNLHESRYSHHTSFKKSPCLNNEFNDSDNTLIITEEDSCCTNSKTGVDFSGQDSLPSVLETSPTNDSDPCKGTSVGKSFCHQESSIPSSPNDELLVGSGSCKRRSSEIILKEVGQKRRVISAQHRVYGKNLLKSACYGSLDLPSHSNTSTSMEVVDERLEIPPLGSKRCGNGRFPTFNHYNDLAAEKAAIGDKKNKDSGNQASGSGKKIHKKSKKISEIRVGKVNDSCDIKFTKAQKFHFDDKNECRLKFPCNQEDSHMLACKLTLECAKKSTCATGESILTRNSVKKMERSETKTSKHVKDKKRFAMSLDDEVESKLIHANIDEVDIRGPKKKVCNSEGLDFQFPYQSKLLSSAKKAQRKCTEDSVVTSDDCNISTIGKSKNIQISNSVTSIGKSRDAKANPKGAKVKETEVCKKNRWKRPRGFRINDDDLLIAAIIKNKDYVSCHDKKGPKLGVSQPKKLKKFEIQKAGCKLQLRTPGKGGMPKDGLGAISGARTVLCWLIERGVLSQKDVLQYRNPKNNELVKEGWITRDGILCKCCMETFSVSVFKAHCGSKHQKPSSNLFLESGRSFTLCQLQVWSAEYKARKNRMINMGAEEVDQNDDTCGLCVDGGELICCDNCPSTYHQTCLSMQDLPEGSWYCHTCICKSCGEVVKETKEDSRSLTALECSQCEHKYHDDCAKKINSSDRDLEFIAWFCGRKCKEVYLGLRTRVGILNSLADGYSWTILRCNHDDQKINSTQKIALMAECNTKLAIALSIMEECFLPMVDPRTGINMIPHVLYNWGSNFIRLNYQGFYTVVLEKGDEIISVASIRVHGVTVAEMPLVATSSEHRRQGMCRRLIDALEKMLRSFKVQMLVLSAIPGLVETWTSHFGFKPIGDAERRMLNHVNLMLFPGTELLIKYLGEAKVEESGSDTGSLLRSSQCSNPDGFSETVLKTTVQAEEIAKTGTHDGALLPTPDAVYLRHEEHDCQQKDILISFCDTDKTTPKPNDNYNMPDPLWSKEENLHSDEPGIVINNSDSTKISVLSEGI